jgi:hypothetical protein
MNILELGRCECTHGHLSANVKQILPVVISSKGTFQLSSVQARGQEGHAFVRKDCTLDAEYVPLEPAPESAIPLSVILAPGNVQ